MWGNLNTEGGETRLLLPVDGRMGMGGKGSEERGLVCERER